jgi:VWFA-related protein
MTRTIPFLAMIGLLLCVPASVLPQQTPSSQPSPQPPPSQQQVPPQQPTPPQQQPSLQRGATPQGKTQAPLIVRSEAVIVPVTVKDGHGQLVGDLERDDFRIFEDDVEQKIASFSSDPVPLSAVVLIDNDLSQKNANQVQKSLVSIAAGFGPSDEVALVTYDEFPNTVSDFSSDNDKLYTQLKRVELGGHSTMIVNDPTTAGPVINGQKLPDGTGIPLHGASRVKVTAAVDDALFSAGQMLKARDRGRRKIIFLVTDGSDSRNDAHTFDETLRTLLSSDVSVYSIAVTRTLPLGGKLLQHGASQVDRYVSLTGGDRFYADKEGDLDRLYSSVTEQARNQYTITFTPEDVHGAKDYHSIEVRVRRTGLDVYARQGYYQSAASAGR